jgi:beta-glucosidase
LLKNNGILPLSKNLKSISVIGPNADNVYNQLGDYTAPQDTNQVITVLKGIKRAVSPTTIVRYTKGCAFALQSTDDADC